MLIFLLYFFIFIIGQTISYKGTSFLTLLYEWFRLLTEASSLLAIKVADAGFVGNVLHCLDVLVSTAQYNEVGMALMYACSPLMLTYYDIDTHEVYDSRWGNNTIGPENWHDTNSC